jgi:hypothetical protein
MDLSEVVLLIEAGADVDLKDNVSSVQGEILGWIYEY